MDDKEVIETLQGKLDIANQLIKDMSIDLDAWFEAYPDCEETKALVLRAKDYLKEIDR